LLDTAEDLYIIGKKFAKIKAVNIVGNKSVAGAATNVESMLFVDIDPTTSFAAAVADPNK
jgi:hypothetical protein